MTTTGRPAGNHSRSVEKPRWIDFRGDLLTVSAGAPLPPGSRVAFPLDVGAGDTAIPVTGKIVSSTPLSDGGFKLVIRLNSLTREHRTALAAARQASGSGR